MLKALLPWMDTEVIFAVLLEQEPHSLRIETPVARPPAIPDTVLLKRLIPAELYRAAIEAGWMGMHALSFALRYRITELQLLFHQAYENVEAALRQCLMEIWQREHGSVTLPLFGFSPLGIHRSARPAHLCRGFDALSLASCLEPAEDIFCAAHAGEAFWKSNAPCTQQATMFRYYADLENFSLYGEADLEAMVGAFWKRYRAYSHEDLKQALEYFGLRDAEELRDQGYPELRRKFLQLSLIHHPDRGGVDAHFVWLQTHYQRLKQYLEACQDLGQGVSGSGP